MKVTFGGDPYEHNDGHKWGNSSKGVSLQNIFIQDQNLEVALVCLNI